ncbi:MAG TPA: adenylate/guanylate cyclase domain-containing protein, partial [Candidatus Limnocylindrales bacterium]|nr:adenylate/guanylate cyclase domain-containing protein [Candidatus Limnocylindrales bacterium]
PNAGFVIATPVGLVLAAIFAAASISPIAGPRAAPLLRHRLALRRVLLAAMVGWAGVSVLRLPPLNGPLPPEEAAGPIGILAFGAVVLYAAAAWRYAEIYRRRQSGVALAIVAALVLLAEAMVAVALSANWHLSWWEWHVLMTVAFALIAIGVRNEYRRTGSLVATFGPIYQEATLARIDRWHGRAIADLVAREERGEPSGPVLEDLRRDGASTDEIQLLSNAAREIRRTNDLFRPYLPQQLASRLHREPSIGDLGGVERRVTVLFADMASFTDFSESRRPTDVLATLNEYWAVLVPVVDRAGGSVEHFAGDGILVMFNTVADQPDHAVRAARCALEMLQVSDGIASEHPGWPRFRIGLNTGRVVVGNVGTEGRRSFAAIGDTTNLASRLLSAAEPGQIVIGEATYKAAQDLIGSGHLQAQSLGLRKVKGKRAPLEVWLLQPADGPSAAI